MRSEFEKYFKENHADSFYSVDAALEMRGDDYIDFHAADLWALWQHQQSKIDELQKRVDALIQKYKDEDRELKLIDEWEKSQIYGLVASELEQVLKGGRE